MSAIVTEPAGSRPPAPELSPEQRAIVEWGDGPLVVIAGAGTGKTRVIVERVRYLLETNGEAAWTATGLPTPAEPGRHDPPFDGPLAPEQILEERDVAAAKLGVVDRCVLATDQVGVLVEGWLLGGERGEVEVADERQVARRARAERVVCRADERGDPRRELPLRSGREQRLQRELRTALLVVRNVRVTDGVVEPECELERVRVAGVPAQLVEEAEALGDVRQRVVVAPGLAVARGKGLVDAVLAVEPESIGQVVPARL